MVTTNLEYYDVISMSQWPLNIKSEVSDKKIYKNMIYFLKDVVK